MHIAGVMAALEVDDLDRTAKQALVVVCCRADYPSGWVQVSVARVAKDMKLDRNTARKALGRVVTANYLVVDKPPGLTPTWRLTPRIMRGVTPRIQTPDPAHLDTEPRASAHPVREKDLRKESDAAFARFQASGAAVEKPAGVWSQDLPSNPWVYDEETGLAYHRDRLPSHFDQNGHEDDESCPDPAAIAATIHRHPAARPES